MKRGSVKNTKRRNVKIMKGKNVNKIKHRNVYSQLRIVYLQLRSAYTELSLLGHRTNTLNVPQNRLREQKSMENSETLYLLIKQCCTQSDFLSWDLQNFIFLMSLMTIF